MSESLAVGTAVARPDAAVQASPAALDSRRKLQLGLGVIWLLDGVLQLQPFMFGKGFPRMLAENAPGNPAFVARPITWSAGFIDHHLVVLNAVFALIQLALGLLQSPRLGPHFAQRNPRSVIDKNWRMRQLLHGTNHFCRIVLPQ